eukprot:TRINITY_DN5472_c0_g1_i1.p1 TRINITY_DN5472_c0_g1~~TRINITY_DN5472_c0_g1_i1.p1  ORF type:complete len:177 (-),score=29.74 TRINITY_DN5472_c0_g1_i1:54-584(-)
MTDPIALLQHAYEQSTNVKGTSTGVVVVLNGSSVVGANLGDSQYIIIRDGSLLFSSNPQQVEFNTPYQMGTGSPHTPKTHAEKTSTKVQANDWVLVASDGLWDNVPMVAILSHFKKDSKLSITKMAQDIAKKASDLSTKKGIPSPFAKEAHKNNVPWQGGKPDDITVLLGKVVPKS